MNTGEEGSEAKVGNVRYEFTPEGIADQHNSWGPFVTYLSKYATPGRIIVILFFMGFLVSFQSLNDNSRLALYTLT